LAGYAQAPCEFGFHEDGRRRVTPPEIDHRFNVQSGGRVSVETHAILFYRLIEPLGTEQITRYDRLHFDRQRQIESDLPGLGSGVLPFNSPVILTVMLSRDGYIY
jgi:hypothetical protein